uniref:PPPDE domain-containing protein n=1 Tax=Chromera velia CCMP2878 TaxID=1169474 RepID=A0A0G4HKB7_9ALVE|eukprot:Cvel_28568.t1-p1 / transcript=Cvel_28568.t1 / gene=Cvel_28568 / organism=Chromera_velia_CCMP2878 / gene_product=DeSI-like protein At4g17486, putative / transcript_product=DeSI-like protein At4g17486, putative / location=Cvel_scaffold3762:3873-5955(-) / protein_length=226 / sequence_SO=supercontig / SO=protein_coding / is_pseudo=false
MGIRIRLNVYDLVQQQNSFFGVYHSGVEIMGAEWTFASGSGIFSHLPRAAPEARFRCSHDLGESNLEMSEIIRAIDGLRFEGGWGGGDYDLIERNCNHFADALCKRILRGKGIPSYVNRLANWGRCFSCLIPPEVRGGPGSGGRGGSSSQGSRMQPTQSSTRAFSGSGQRLQSSSSSSQYEVKMPLLSSLFGQKNGDGQEGTGGGDREKRARAALSRFSTQEGSQT